ncbi:MAG: metallopeptidase TldD-related protein [Cyanobacteria bacterium P01_C01_bin.89]
MSVQGVPSEKFGLKAVDGWEEEFNWLCDSTIATLKANEHLSLELSGESTQFMRLNNSKVRQSGTVTAGYVSMQLIDGDRTATMTVPFTGDRDLDRATVLEGLNDLRQELPQLPADPYVVLPANLGSSRDSHGGKLLDPDQVADALLTSVQDIDFTGIYASGAVVRATGNSAGQRHWFATETFDLDYSVIGASERAVKGALAGQAWDQEKFESQVRRSRSQLVTLESQPFKKIKPGQYRTYLAPAAVTELVFMFSWGAVSEASVRQGESALAKMRDGRSLSHHFTLVEDFTQGTVPRFNSLGEVSTPEVPIIVEGELRNTLVSTRTAKEYGIKGNAASDWEGLRSPRIASGTLAEADILRELDCGLYLSNLHYLNWSDQPGGRITGMTRYACFWVENGEIQAPIQDLRFDDSLYNFFGPNLVACTDTAEFVPDPDTYEERSIGGVTTPGVLINDFTFTL